MNALAVVAGARAWDGCSARRSATAPVQRSVAVVSVSPRRRRCSHGHREPPDLRTTSAVVSAAPRSARAGSSYHPRPRDRAAALAALGADTRRGPAQDHPAGQLHRERREMIHAQVRGHRQRLRRDLPHAARQLPQRVDRGRAARRPWQPCAALDGAAARCRLRPGRFALAGVRFADLVYRRVIPRPHREMEQVLVRRPAPVRHRLRQPVRLGIVRQHARRQREQVRLISHADVVELPRPARPDGHDLAVLLGVVMRRARPAPLAAPAGESPVAHLVNRAPQADLRAEPGGQRPQVGGPARRSR